MALSFGVVTQPRVSCVVCVSSGATLTFQFPLSDPCKLASKLQTYHSFTLSSTVRPVSPMSSVGNLKPIESTSYLWLPGSLGDRARACRFADRRRRAFHTHAAAPASRGLRALRTRHEPTRNHAAGAMDCAVSISRTCICRSPSCGSTVVVHTSFLLPMNDGNILQLYTVCVMVRHSDCVRAYMY